MPDTPICPIMSKVVYCSELDVERQVHFKPFFQPCIGSKCAAWHSFGSIGGVCAMMPRSQQARPDPAIPEETEQESSDTDGETTDA